MVWDVLSGVTKTAWDDLSAWQIDAGCFVRGVKKWLGCFVLHSKTSKVNKLYMQDYRVKIRMEQTSL